MILTIILTLITCASILTLICGIIKSEADIIVTGTVVLIFVGILGWGLLGPICTYKETSTPIAANVLKQEDSAYILLTVNGEPIHTVKDGQEIKAIQDKETITIIKIEKHNMYGTLLDGKTLWKIPTLITNK